MEDEKGKNYIVIMWNRDNPIAFSNKVHGEKQIFPKLKTALYNETSIIRENYLCATFLLFDSYKCLLT